MLKNVQKFIKKYRLSSKHLSYATLKDIFIRLGYDVIFFHPLHNSEEVQAIIDTYNLKQHIATKKSFIIVNNSVKLVFLHDNMAEDDLIHYALHELGHIWLKHLPDTYNEDKQEREADEFSVLVRAILQYTQKRNKRIAIICSSLILVVCVYFSHESNVSDTPVQNQTIQTVSTPKATPLNSKISDVTVVKTSSGEKYHKPDCRYVKNKTNISELTLEEGMNSGLEPCSICRPNE